jgi:hypothetical protein
MGCTEQRFSERRDLSQPHIHARAEHVSKCRLVDVQVMNVSVVHSIETAYRGKPMIKVEGDLPKSAIRRKCRDIDTRVDACE